MRRDINYLLKKYSSDKLAEGEIWSTESETRKKQNQRLKQKYFTFDCLNSHHLRLTGTSKERAKYLIKKLEFKRSRLNEEQIIIMIMLYVKLKEGYRIQQYNYLLSKYGLNYETFINFLTKII